MKLPDLSEVTKKQSARDVTKSTDASVARDNSEKSRVVHDVFDKSSESDVLEKDASNVQSSSLDNENIPSVKDVTTISKELSGVETTDSNDFSAKEPLSEEKPSMVPIKVEKLPKKPNPSEVIVVDDSDVEMASDKEIDDDIAEPHQTNVDNNPDNPEPDMSRASVLPDFDYIDDDLVYEEPVQLHRKVEDSFIKYKDQGAH